MLSSSFNVRKKVSRGQHTFWRKQETAQELLFGCKSPLLVGVVDRVDRVQLFSHTCTNLILMEELSEEPTAAPWPQNAASKAYKKYKKPKTNKSSQTWCIVGTCPVVWWGWTLWLEWAAEFVWMEIRRAFHEKKTPGKLWSIPTNFGNKQQANSKKKKMLNLKIGNFYMWLTTPKALQNLHWTNSKVTTWKLCQGPHSLLN